MALMHGMIEVLLEGRKMKTPEENGVGVCLVAYNAFGKYVKQMVMSYRGLSENTKGIRYVPHSSPYKPDRKQDIKGTTLEDCVDFEEPHSLKEQYARNLFDNFL